MSGFREGRKEGEWEILLREVGSLGELEEDTAVSAAGVLLRWGQMRKGKKAVQRGSDYRHRLQGLRGSGAVAWEGNEEMQRIPQ